MFNQNRHQNIKRQSNNQAADQLRTHPAHAPHAEMREGAARLLFSLCAVLNPFARLSLYLSLRHFCCVITAF
jgi:hypothetical protein